MIQDFHPNHGGDAAASGVQASVSQRREGPGLVLSARGEFDVLTTPQLRLAIREALAEAPPVLVIDLTEVEFFSSAALGALVEAREATGETIELAVGRSLDRTLNLVGLDTAFARYRSAAEALATGSN